MDEKSPYDDVAVRVVPRHQSEGERYAAREDEEGAREGEEGARKDAPARLYDALIYSHADLPALKPADETHRCERDKLGGLPLRGVEEVGVDWGLYRRYVSSYAGGESAVRVEDAGRIFLQPTEALVRLLTLGANTNRRSRIWWSCSKPNLSALPWELLAHIYNLEPGTTPPLFVRGVPTTRTPPRVPVTGKLRLAFIHDPRQTPSHLHAALDKLEGVEVVPMYEPPRRALTRAIAEGFELVHLVTDGTVTPGYEGVLHFSLSEHKPSKLDFAAQSVHRVYRWGLEGALALQRVLPNPAIYWLSDHLYGKLDFETFSPRELSAMWRGSRVVAASLSAPSTAERSPERFDGFLLPNVYRAFVAFGSSTLPMPNLVAPIGAMSDDTAERFWRSFYERVASPDCFSVELAVEEARERAGAAPVALFLRQRLGQDFARPAEGSMPPHGKLRQVYSELVAAEDLLAQLKALDAKYEGVVDEKLSEATYSRESARQEVVKSELDGWTRAAGEGEEEAAT